MSQRTNNGSVARALTKFAMLQQMLVIAKKRKARDVALFESEK